jgi:hypothetical protein
MLSKLNTGATVSAEPQHTQYEDNQRKRVIMAYIILELTANIKTNQ